MPMASRVGKTVLSISRQPLCLVKQFVPPSNNVLKPTRTCSLRSSLMNLNKLVISTVCFLALSMQPYTPKDGPWDWEDLPTYGLSTLGLQEAHRHVTEIDCNWYGACHYVRADKGKDSPYIKRWDYWNE
jgi:hypothetical protein